jgi:hypothetical protein
LSLAAIVAGTGLASAQTYLDPVYPHERSHVRYAPQPAYPGMYYSPYGYDGTGNPSAGRGAVNPGSLNAGPDTAG